MFIPARTAQLLFGQSCAETLPVSNKALTMVKKIFFILFLLFSCSPSLEVASQKYK